MSKPKILLRFDTKDYITPESNVVLDALLNILEELNIKATFIVVGEKIKMLIDHGETAIIEKLQHHALGYHSYTHSLHPVAQEYLQNVNWETGIEKFLKTEETGHKIFVETFDQPPICYTQPGADWVPHAYIALQQWEIPLFFTEEKNSLLNLTAQHQKQQPFLVNGILTLACNPTISDLTNLSSSTLNSAKYKFEWDYQTASQSMGLGLIPIICHPERLITSGDQPWDMLNYANGKNKPRQEWQIPPLKSKHIYEEDLNAFKQFLIYLKENYELDWITAQDLVDIYQNRIIHKDRVIDTLTQGTCSIDQTNTLEFSSILNIATHFRKEISFYGMGNIWLSPIQVASILCQTLLIRAQEGYFPSSVPIPTEIFFPERIPEVTVTKNLDRIGWSELVQGSKKILHLIKTKTTFPPKIKVGVNIWIELETFIGGVAQAIVTMASDHLPQDRILLPNTKLQTKDYVKKIDQANWSWPIFSYGFQNCELLNYTELLSWTLKPI
ncbi:MAG: hypothetical protein KAX49_15805 [Halanaerobiales bacterium]|nr:hypothetical protein [Halanaerobiales bacterium]